MPYVLNVFTGELSKKLNGIISDEGIKDKWKGNPDDYPSYKNWIKEYYGDSDPIFIDNKCMEYDLKDDPEELRDC